MKNIKTLILTGLFASAMGACAGHDHQDKYLLGGATQTNIALQSVRDVKVPNSEEVGETSGVRGANAVKALNEGKRKEFRSSDEGTPGVS